jgi:hypothetical protein
MSTQQRNRTQELIDASISYTTESDSTALTTPELVGQIYSSDSQIGGFMLYLIDKFEAQGLSQEQIEQRVYGCALGITAMQYSTSIHEHSL